MPKFAANLTMLFTELPFLDRFEPPPRPASRRSSILFPYALRRRRSGQRLRRQRPDSRCCTTCRPATGTRASAASPACPDRVDEFRDGVGKAIDYATALGCRQLNCLAGKAPGGVDEATLRETFVANLRFAADELEEAGIKLLIEPINTFDIPGFFLTRTTQALAMIDEVGADNLFVQYDIYHAQRMEGELAATLAEAPGPHRPHPAGRQPGPQRAGHRRDQLPFLFAHLDRIGYGGWIGCEYKPAATTEAGLGWFTKG